jgi:hypothetical protein
MRIYRVFDKRGEWISTVEADSEKQAVQLAKEKTVAPMVELVLTTQEQQQLLYVEQKRMFSYRNSWADHPHYSETWQ